jgi:hypothetical protein
VANVVDMAYMFNADNTFCQYLCWDLSTAIDTFEIGARVEPGPRHSLHVKYGVDCECGDDQTLNPAPGHRGVCEGNANTSTVAPVRDCAASLLEDDVASLQFHAFILLSCFVIVLLVPCVYYKLTGAAVTSQKGKDSSDSSGATTSPSCSSRCLGRLRACWTPLVAVCVMQVMSCADFVTDMAVYSVMVLPPYGELPCQFGGLGNMVPCEEPAEGFELGQDSMFWL